jgi:hypothetical protein
VDEFLELTLSAPTKEALQRLDTHLTLRTFLADHNATIADFFVWAWLLNETSVSSFSHLSRWFAHFPKHVALVLGTAGPASATTTTPPATTTAGGEKKKEDDFDLFGEEEEDAEHEKLLEQRRKVRVVAIAISFVVLLLFFVATVSSWGFL